MTQTITTTQNRAAGWELYQLEHANGQLNTVFGHVTAHTGQVGQPTPARFHEQLAMMRTTHDAVAEIAGHDGLADAAAAAREVLPLIQRATQLLEALEGHPVTGADIEPLLHDVGAAMDRIEQLLGAAGFD